MALRCCLTATSVIIPLKKITVVKYLDEELHFKSSTITVLVVRNSPPLSLRLFLSGYYSDFRKMIPVKLGMDPAPLRTL